MMVSTVDVEKWYRQKAREMAEKQEAELRTLIKIKKLENENPGSLFYTVNKEGKILDVGVIPPDYQI
jgi:hypothetical protein